MSEEPRVVMLKGGRDVNVAPLADIETFLLQLLAGTLSKTGAATLKVVKNAAGSPFVAVIIANKHVGFLSHADAEGLLPALAEYEQRHMVAQAKGTVMASLDSTAKPVLKLSLAEPGQLAGGLETEAPSPAAENSTVEPMPTNQPCRSCGKGLPAGAKFCLECGAPVVKPPAAAEERAVQQSPVLPVARTVLPVTGQTAPTGQSSGALAKSHEWWDRRSIMQRAGVVAGAIAVLVTIVAVAASAGGDETKAVVASSATVASAATITSVTTTATTQATTTTTLTFTTTNLLDGEELAARYPSTEGFDNGTWNKLIEDPEAHLGAAVTIYGRPISSLEGQGDTRSWFFVLTNRDGRVQGYAECYAEVPTDSLLAKGQIQLVMGGHVVGKGVPYAYAAEQDVAHPTVLVHVESVDYTTGYTTTTTAAPTTTTERAVDKAKFANAWAAYKAVSAATAVGVTYINFGPLVQKLATECSLIPTRNLTHAESHDLGVLNQVTTAYADSYALWELCLSDDLATIWSEDTVAYNRAKGWVSKYGLSDPSTEGLICLFKSDVATIWNWASTRGDALAGDLAP
jgi:hypothetical protein